MSATAIVGGQYGSEGKGAVVAALAHEFDAAVRTGGPNAGHSLWHDGRVYKMRQVPCTWIGRGPLILGAGATVDLQVLGDEILDTGVDPARIQIDRNAVLITHQDRVAEAESALTKMGSTLEGVGAARVKKIRRDVQSFPLMRHAYGDSTDTVQLLWEMLNRGQHVLLEGTQGSGLSLHHGLWPYVTSNDTNAGQLLADAGIAPGWLEHTLLVVRTYPIRVGGPSGPMPGGEIEFTDIPGNVEPERTTVTKRVRRISGWDQEVVNRAVMLNDPCGIVVTFTDYLDPAIRGETIPALIRSKPIYVFLRQLYRETRVPVVMLGTGGERFSMVPWGPCKHEKEWIPQ